MPVSVRLIASLALTAFILAGCGEHDYSKFNTQLTSYEGAAVTSANVAGTFPLTHINKSYLPADYVFVDGCMVWITGGELELTTDATYSLALQTETVCGDESTATSEVRRDGLYRLLGHELRFGDRIVPQNSELAPETVGGDEELGEIVFPDGRFAARGTVRYDRISATISDFHTFVFARD